MLSQNNISHVFVAEGTGLSTGAVSALSSGQLGVYQNGETTGDAGALVAGDKFQVFLKDLNGNLVNSPWIDFDNIKSSNAVDYTAPTEKKVYVGYNGTTGSIGVANSTVYNIHMNIQDGSKTWGEHPLFKFVAAYESDASATQTEIADALIVNASKNFAREAAQGVDYIAVSRINAEAVTAANDLVNDATVVKDSNTITSAATAQVDTVTLDTGSSGTATIAAAGGLTKTVTFDTDYETSASNFVTANAADYLAEGIVLTSDGDDLIFTASVAGTDFTSPTITAATGDLDGSVVNTQVNVEAFEYAAAGATVAVGDYIRVGSVAGGTALTSSVYKVTAVSGTTGTATITLDIPVVEASGTYAAGTSDIEVIPAANIDDWGLCFEGKALPFDAGLKPYRKVNFEVQLGSDFPTTLQTVDTEASKGEGTYYQVAENEWLLAGNRGEPYRVASFPVSRPLGADSSETYDAVVVHFTNNNSIQIDHEVKSYISLVFYVVTDTAGTSGSTAYTNLKTVFGL